MPTSEQAARGRAERMSGLRGVAASKAKPACPLLVSSAPKPSLREPAAGPRALPPPPPLPACPPAPSQPVRLGGGAQGAPRPYQWAGWLSTRPPLPRKRSPETAVGCRAQQWLLRARRAGGIGDSAGSPELRSGRCSQVGSRRGARGERAGHYAPLLAAGVSAAAAAAAAPGRRRCAHREYCAPPRAGGPSALTGTKWRGTPQLAHRGAGIFSPVLCTSNLYQLLSRGPPPLNTKPCVTGEASSQMNSLPPIPPLPPGCDSEALWGRPWRCLLCAEHFVSTISLKLNVSSLRG